jgi:MFS family permease
VVHVRASVRQLALLIIGISLGSVGWGAVLPFLYADVAEARGLGAGAAAATFVAFALGALLAAPVAGRLADRARPVLVATASRLAMVVAIAALAYSPSAVALWAAALAYGAALAVVQPAVSVLVLELTPVHRRRDAFAAQFIGLNLGLALGGFVGGHLVDLSSPAGVRPAYLFAALSSLASAVLVAAVGRRIRRGRVPVAEPAEEVGYRAVLRAPGVAWLLTVTGLLTLACYAQYDSGLPSYALTVLDVAPSTLGTAVAVNSVLVGVLTAPVLRATRRWSPATLLALCAVVWIGVWLVLAAPLAVHGGAAGFVVTGYGLFSLGETVLAPVLSPLAATLAPAGAVGRTLAAVNGAQTAATALGPALSGLLLGLGAPAAFIALQVLCCLLAAVGARRLRPVTGRAASPESAATPTPAGLAPAVEG